MAEYTVMVPIKITDLDIDYIVVGAFEGGITYWCNGAEITKPPAEPCAYTSTAISRGGEVTLTDSDTGEKYVLTKEKVLEGLRLFLQNPKCWSSKNVFNANGLDDHDAADDDCIIQYGLFGELIFG